MKRFLQIILSALGLCAGCSKESVISPGQFTQECAQVLQAANPGSKVEVVGDLELKFTPHNGTEQSVYLYNTYDTYKSDPASKEQVIEKFAAATLETIGRSKVALDRTLIVPVVKDRPWLEETRQALLSRGAKEVPESVYEDLGPDLVIVYAQDSPQSIRYLVRKDLNELKLEPKDLRALACENLKRLLPPVQRIGTNGLYILQAGGDYDASLVLLDSIWDKTNLDVEGDFVVAIPNRNVLLVTGTGNTDQVAKVKEMAKESYADGAYRLTPKLFVLRNGTLTELRE